MLNCCAATMQVNNENSAIDCQQDNEDGCTDCLDTICGCLDIVLWTIGGFLVEWAEFLGIVHSLTLYCPLKRGLVYIFCCLGSFQFEELVYKSANNSSAPTRSLRTATPVTGGIANIV
jgi:hypothetical protein